MWAFAYRLGWRCSDRLRSAGEQTRRGLLDDEEIAGEEGQQLPPCLRDSAAGTRVVGSRLCRRLRAGLSVLAWWCECEGCATTTTRA